MNTELADKTLQALYISLAKEIMENYPEYSQSVRCTFWNYTDGIFKFVDDEERKAYTVTIAQVAEALPKLRAMLEASKIFLTGLHSGDELFLDASNWDADCTDALVQLAIFGELVYG